MMPRFDGPDCAHYQGDNFPWQWLVDTYAIRFGACKMTEGVGYVDSTGAHNRDAMKHAGVRWRGLYHYARAGDPVANAAHFHDNVGALEDGEFVFLDVESGMTPEVAAVVAMLEAFEAIYPGRTADYQGKFFASGDSPAYARWPWILPAYPWPNQVLPVTTRPVTVWQYAGGAHGVDVPGVGNVDSNMVLIPAELDRICNLTAAPSLPVVTKGQPMYCVDADTGKFWLIFFDGYGNRVAMPLDETADPDWNEFAAVQAAFGALTPVPHDALQRLYDKRGRPQLPPQVVIPPPLSTVARHTHPVGETGDAVVS